MQFEGRRRTSGVPNLTPLIDMVFLLLVFFMLTSHFVREESLAVDLPDAESGVPLQDEHVLEIVVDERSRLRLHNHFIEPANLTAALRQALAGREVRTVRLRGDRRATLDVTVKVLDAARNAGAEGVDIVTEEP
ncbi:MAG: biopolymer transporter ExbD [Gammaproteobacteria bacterium]